MGSPGPQPGGKEPTAGVTSRVAGSSQEGQSPWALFRIRIRQRLGLQIIAATVLVNRRRVRVVRGRRLTAPVDLRGLPKGRYTVEIRVFTADGRLITGKRRYRTCAPKRRPGRPGPL